MEGGEEEAGDKERSENNIASDVGVHPFRKI